MKKILVYSHDAYGLGNIRRMLEIVRHLVNRDTSLLLLSGSPMIHAFRIPPGVDYIKLPSVGRTEGKKSVVRSLNIQYEQVMRLRGNLILRAAVGYRPDLVLVDKKPFGIGNELELALTAMRNSYRPPRVVLLLRDILDAPEATIEEWDEGSYHQVIEDFYDKVLVVGSAQVFDVVREYRFPATTARRLEYCGYLGRTPPQKSIEDTRAELGLNGGHLVLVTAGGGADGYHLMSAYLRGLARRADAGFSSLLVHGPEMSIPNRAHLAALAARCRRLTMREFSDDLLAYMNAADLVVAMGGYNTVCELLTLGKKSIIVPRAVPVQEQAIRAERLHALGLARALNPRELTPKTLIGAVEEELAKNGCRLPSLQGFTLDGLPHVVGAIDGLLGRNAGLARLDVRRRADGRDVRQA